MFKKCEIKKSINYKRFVSLKILLCSFTYIYIRYLGTYYFTIKIKILLTYLILIIDDIKYNYNISLSFLA